MNVTKLSANDTKVLWALRAGPMESMELYERFTGGYAMKSVLDKGYVQFEAGIYKITELGRQVCPTRREIERVKNLPPLPRQPVRKVMPVETININSVPVIKERDNEMKSADKTSKSKVIRDIITSNPGITHDELIAKFFNNQIVANDEIKKAVDLIEYIIRHGGFTRCNDTQVSGDNKIPVKRYYTHADYIKRKETSPILVAHSETEKPIVDAVPKQVHPVAKAIIHDLEATHAAGTNEKSALSVQEGGDHYKRMKIQPVEFIIANEIGFCEGNIIKYVSRWKNKNGVQDLKKARHFIDILIEQQSAA